MNELAINGGTPVRQSMLGYGRQTIDQSDVDAVVEVLTENKYLTTGPRVKKFEEAVCDLLGVKHAVACSNGTTALHLAVAALDLKPDDEVLVAAISFVASSNAVLYCNAKPVFVDVDPATLNIDPALVEEKITSKTRALICVDMAGQLCDYKRCREIADKHKLTLIRDASHSFGVQDAGALAHLSTFSFHPVKNITTGEGGMVATDNKQLYEKLCRLRSHGIDTDYTKRRLYEYDVVELGFNYRLTDLQCALGINQVARLSEWIKRRNDIAKSYNEAFAPLSALLLPVEQRFSSAYHIYIIRLQLDALSGDRDQVFAALKAENIGVNVHYKPMHMQTLYQNLGYKLGSLPKAEQVYQQIITLPVFPTMEEQDVKDVIQAVVKVLTAFRK